ncbi:UNVERIFIED_CONTAM: hypothetical protein FKN15_036271, partial [Acipenser sinensis]
CTKLCRHKPHNPKDDAPEKQCPVTVNPRHMKKAFKVMNELRSVIYKEACIQTECLYEANEQHFAEVVQSEEFLNLGIEQVYSLIASDKLTIPSEEKVFEAVIAWVNHDKEVRQEHMSHLMEHVRLPLLSREYLVQRVEEESLVKNSSACKDYLIEAMKYHLLPADQRSMMKTIRTRMRTPINLPKVMVVVGGQAPKAIRSVECYDFKEERWYQVAELPSRRCRSDYLIEAMKYHLLPADQRSMMKTIRTRMRTPINLPKVMVVVGGQAPKAIRSVECYDFKEERWYQVAELPSRRCRSGVVCMGGFVYAVGGFNGSLRVRTVDSYDPVKDQWTCVASMQNRRSTLGAAVLNGLLYAVGGFDGSTGLSTVEAYNAKKNEWFLIVPMNTRRSSVGVGVVGGLLYAVGGYDGASRQCLSTVEAYHPNANEWNYVAEMSTRRSGAGVGVLKGLLYAVGGHDGPLVRKSCEVYDPATNTWKQVADMNMCRRNAGVCAVSNLLYVVGGDDGSCNLSSVEYYNPSADKWTLLPACMSTGRSYAVILEEWAYVPFKKDNNLQTRYVKPVLFIVQYQFITDTI